MNGSREVTFAVLAATLSLVAIFAPVIFIGGIIGQFFESFAVVVTFGVLVSLVRLAHADADAVLALPAGAEAQGRVYRTLDRFFAGLENAVPRHARLVAAPPLERARARRSLSAFGGLLLQHVGKELAPQQDEGEFLVSMRTPLGSSIQYTEAQAARSRGDREALPGSRNRVGHHRPGPARAGEPGDAVIGAHEAARASASARSSRCSTTSAARLAEMPGARVFPRGFGVVPRPADRAAAVRRHAARICRRWAAHATEIQRAAAGQPGDRAHGHRPAARPAAAGARPDRGPPQRSA